MKQEYNSRHFYSIRTTARYKAMRIIKYVIVLLIFALITNSIDAVIHQYFTDPLLEFKHDWLVLYGAMVYRLISTWEYK